eukprot:CAMPEP_0194746810 /NCGR_PEP_ID=MMETSP0323_2-20130528/816_1 /TAXON_ID=2866 ORGANISM="Crypthecodinium cohnii, Strain Seligo" /NCGR_SAMPLE_ID=MMETSP0323_2 /ASSEMBLY_ACC=CAM_ASM_000346 /LENGTH=63 /DNA_ID=CAMNT_0039659587 /DNA_START=250 /DNA_END=441 /DNA_ORIENTATION=+
MTANQNEAEQDEVKKGRAASKQRYSRHPQGPQSSRVRPDAREKARNEENQESDRGGIPEEQRL